MTKLLTKSERRARERFAADDRAFEAAIAASAAADVRCLAALAELPAIRADLRRTFEADDSPELAVQP